MAEFPTDYVSKGAVEYVYTTHVKHQEQFFVHLDSNSSILEDIMYCLENRYTQLGGSDKILPHPKLGGLCAAKFTDDNNWYRAKITGLIQSGLVEVQFVDYGNTDYVDRDRIKVLDPDLIQYPVQCYRCALAGVSCEQGYWPPELMVQFEDLVIDKKCKAVFQGKSPQEDVYLLDLYDEDGNYVNVLFGASEPIRRSVETNRDLSVKVTVNQNGKEATGFQNLTWKAGDKIQASVVYVENPNLFWCQDVAFLNNIIILSEELSRLHMTQEMRPLKDIKPGAICAAKFDEDDAWYRGIVQVVSKNTATIYFVDYGNTENVRSDCICDLKAEFRDLPALGIKCFLADMKSGNQSWAQDVIEEFENLVMDKEFEVKVVGKQGLLYEVTLLDVEENQDIGIQLQKIVGLKSSKAKIPPKEKKSTPPTTGTAGTGLAIGTTSNVFLTWVDDPANFWVQHEDSAPLLDKLSADLQEYYSQPQPEAMSARGAFVIARFSEDEQWYRGLVVKEMEDSVKVLFIDYGNTETTKKSELRKASPQFADVDPLAICCSLADVKPLRQDNSWSRDAKHFLEQLTENGCQCEVISKKGDFRIVRLTVDGKDVASELGSLAVVMNAAQSKPTQYKFSANINLSPNKVENVFVSHVDSPHSLWVQLSRNCPQLDSLMEKLDCHYSEDGGTAFGKPCIGDACVAQYSADNAWYRAVVVNLANSGCEVRFVDYGNTEVVASNLVCVPEPRFLDLPPQAIQCSLSVQGNQQHLTDSLSEMVLDKELQMKVMTASGSIPMIELVDNSQSITVLLQQQTMVATGGQTLAPTNISFGSKVNAYTSVVLSPSKFFLQMTGIDDELASLMSQITDLYAAHEGISPLSQADVGVFCVALYQEDQQWYRGKITAVQGSQCMVLFVDYGNEELISNSLIKELSPEICNVPILATECTLDGVSCEAWTESAIEFFESLVMDQELSCTFSSKKSVSMICNGENLAEKLVAAGYGKSTTVSTVSSRNEQWKEETSPASGKAPAWDDKPARKSGFEKSPRNAIEGSGEGFGGGRKRDFSDGSDQGPKKGGWDNKESGGFGGGRKKDFGDASDQGPKRGGMDNKESGGFGGGRKNFGDNSDQGPRRGGMDKEPGRFGQRDGSGSDSKADTFQYGDPPSEAEDAILIHIDDDGTFYLQLMSMEKEIMFLTRRLAGSYKTGGPRLKESPVKGTVCCCKYPDDGSMYRSQVEDLRGNEVLVRYVDYGNVAQCGKHDLKFLFPDLLQYSVQAYPCKLRGFQWSIEKAELFGKATLDKDLTVTFTSTSPPFLVDIATPDGDLLAIMEGRAAPPAKKLSPKPSSFGGSKPSFGGSKTSPKQGGFGSTKPNQGFGDSSPKQTSSGSLFKKALNFEAPSHPKVPNQVFTQQRRPNGPQTAFISHISGDGFFYIQLDKDTEILEKLTDKLISLSSGTRHPNLSVGAACAAVFSEDSAWYRAVILKQDANKYQVSFVDFGNGDTVEKSNILPLTTELLESPPLSYQCKFSDCELLSEEGQTKLSEYLLEHQITVTFENANTPYSISATTSDGQNLQDVIYPSNKFRSQHIPDEVTPAGVSHIHEDGRFFLQLYRDYKAIDQLQVSLDTAYSSVDVETLSSAEADMSCCVKSAGDERWHRAKILKVIDSNAYVSHVDFGQNSTVTLESVKILLPEFLKKPPFALECRLKDVDSWTEELLGKFTEMISDKILNTTFHSRMPPLRVSLARSIELDLLGLKGPIQESPKRASPNEKANASLSTESTTCGEDAYITEVLNGGQFYIQMVSREEELGMFSDKLEASLESAAQPESIQEGQLLCAKFSEDEAWYRASVEKIEDGQHTVRFIDYGNSDCLGKEALAVLPDDMTTDHVAPFAFKGELDCKPKLTAELSEKLKTLVMDKTVGVKVVSDIDNGLRVVQVYLEGQAVIDLLGLPTAEIDVKASESLLPGSMTFGEDAYITEVVSGGQFYIQMVSREEELGMFSDKLEASLESAAQPESIQEGQLLCAKFSEDEAWYRASVEKIEDGQHTVRFIDYGNSDCLGKEALAVLPDDMTTDHVAPFAFKGELDCKPKLTAALSEKLKTLVMDKTVGVKVVSDIDNGLRVVQVYLEGQAVTDLLGLQTSSAEAGELSSIGYHCDSVPDINSNILPEGERVSVTVIFVDSPSKFYIQFEKNQSALDSMMDDLFESISSLPEGEGLVENVEKGDLLAALYEDESWYRVQVDDVKEDGTIQIFYIDHGNTESVSDKSSLRHLPTKLKEMPMFGKPATLFGVKSKDTHWTEEAIEIFKSIVEEKSMIADLISQDSEPVLVQLLDMGTPVHQTLIDKGFGVGTGAPASTAAQHIFSDASESILEDTKATEDSIHSTRKICCISQTLEELVEVAAFVSHCDNPFQFWCQLASSTDALDEISDSLQKAYTDQPTEDDKLECDVVPNDIIVARFADDGLYYRSTVLNVDTSSKSEHKISVRFIDYGNCSDCGKDDVLKLREDFYKYPAQVFPCSLDGVSPKSGSEWPSEVCNRFSELVTDQELNLKLVGKKQDGTALVELVVSEDGTSIASALVEETIAKFSESTEVNNVQCKHYEDGKDVSGMEALELTRPIMESTAMIHDTSSSTDEINTSSEMVSFEEIYDGDYKVLRLRHRCNYDVYVTDDELPNAFCIQLKEFSTRYKSLMADIAEYISSDAATDNGDWIAKAHNPCLFPFQDEWYRGLIRCRPMNRDESLTSWTVRSVDCGWDVTLMDTELKPIPEQFLDLPTQAVPCYLAGIVSVETNWNAESLSFFSDFVKDDLMRIYVLETGDDGKYGVFMNDADTSTTQSLNRAFVDIGYAEVVPGSYIDVTFDMEKTLNTDMLNALEESFNEVGLERENNLDENETGASSSKADTFVTTFEESFVSKPVTANVDQHFYKLIDIQNASEKQSTDENNSKAANLVAKSVAFSIATAVDRIDELGCIDLFPDESFPTFLDDVSSVLYEKNDSTANLNLPGSYDENDPVMANKSNNNAQSSDDVQLCDVKIERDNTTDNENCKDLAPKNSSLQEQCVADTIAVPEETVDTDNEISTVGLDADHVPEETVDADNEISTVGLDADHVPEETVDADNEISTVGLYADACKNTTNLATENENLSISAKQLSSVGEPSENEEFDLENMNEEPMSIKISERDLKGENLRQNECRHETICIEEDERDDGNDVVLSEDDIHDVCKEDGSQNGASQDEPQKTPNGEAEEDATTEIGRSSSVEGITEQNSCQVELLKGRTLGEIDQATLVTKQLSNVGEPSENEEFDLENMNEEPMSIKIGEEDLKGENLRQNECRHETICIKEDENIKENDFAVGEPTVCVLSENHADDLEEVKDIQQEQCLPNQSWKDCHVGSKYLNGDLSSDTSLLGKEERPDEGMAKVIVNDERDDGNDVVLSEDGIHDVCKEDGSQKGASQDEPQKTPNGEAEEDATTEIGRSSSVEGIAEQNSCQVELLKGRTLREIDQATLATELKTSLLKKINSEGDSGEKVHGKDDEQGLQSLDNTLDEYESCSEAFSDPDQINVSFPGNGLGDDSVGEGASCFDAHPDTDTSCDNTGPLCSYRDTSGLLYDSQADVSLNDSYTSAYWDGCSFSSSSSDVYGKDDTHDTSDFSHSIVASSDVTDSTDAMTDLSHSTVNASDVTDSTDDTSSTTDTSHHSTVTASNVTDSTNDIPTEDFSSFDASQFSSLTDDSFSFSIHPPEDYDEGDVNNSKVDLNDNDTTSPFSPSGSSVAVLPFSMGEEPLSTSTVQLSSKQHGRDEDNTGKPSDGTHHAFSLDTFEIPTSSQASVFDQSTEDDSSQPEEPEGSPGIEGRACPLTQLEGELLVGREDCRAYELAERTNRWTTSACVVDHFEDAESDPPSFHLDYEEGETVKNEDAEEDFVEAEKGEPLSISPVKDSEDIVEANESSFDDKICTEVKDEIGADPTMETDEETFGDKNVTDPTLETDEAISEDKNYSDPTMESDEATAEDKNSKTALEETGEYVGDSIDACDALEIEIVKEENTKSDLGEATENDGNDNKCEDQKSKETIEKEDD